MNLMELVTTRHFSLLRKRLEELGSYYGAHTVHAGLWESAQQTAHSLSSRLCIIHLVHEARGLDVNVGVSCFYNKCATKDMGTLARYHRQVP